MQKWQILNSDYCDYICFENENKLLCLINKETGKEKPLHFFKELEDLKCEYISLIEEVRNDKRRVRRG